MEQPIVNPVFVFWLNSLGLLIPHKLCDSVFSIPVTEMLLPEIKTHLEELSATAGRGSHLRGELLLVNESLDQMSILKNGDFLFHSQSLLRGFSLAVGFRAGK